MYLFEHIIEKHSFEFNQTGELFREEVELYISEESILITSFQMINKENTVELSIETNGINNLYFTYDKRNSEYGVVKATSDEFEMMSDFAKV